MRRPLVLAVVLAASSFAGVALADAPTVVVTKTNPELALRVRGQTNDIGLTVVSSDSAVDAGPLGEQLRSADRIAAATHATIVVWFDLRDPRKLLVCIAAGDRVLVRTIDVATTPPSSAVLESAALVVRSALRALARGGTIGVERPVDEAPVAPPPSIAPRQTPRTTPRAPVAPVSVPGAAFRADAGMMVGLAAARAIGALDLRLGATWGRFVATLRAGVGLPLTLIDSYGAVKLTRDDLAAELGVVALDGPWELGVGVRGGVARFHRETVTLSDDLRPTVASNLTSFLGGAFLWIGGPAWRAMRFAVAMGADVLGAPPIIGYGVGSGFVETQAISSFSPWITASLRIDVGR